MKQPQSSCKLFCHFTEGQQRKKIIIKKAKKRRRRKKKEEEEAQALDRRQKNPEFNGKWESIHTSQKSKMLSHRAIWITSIINLHFPGQSFLLIYIYTYNHCAYYIDERHNIGD